MPRFFLDVMLGSLARRLRLAGFDTAYERDIEDGELVRRAVAEERTIVTRDVLLTHRRLAKGSVLIKANDLEGQWQELLAVYPEVTEGPVCTRCAECNTPLLELDRETARPLVPPYVYETQERFVQCPACQRVYWHGTHAPRIRQAIHGERPE